MSVLCMHVLCIICLKTTICFFLGTRSGFFGEDRLATLSKQQILSFIVYRFRRALGLRIWC